MPRCSGREIRLIWVEGLEACLGDEPREASVSVRRLRKSPSSGEGRPPLRPRALAAPPGTLRRGPGSACSRCLELLRPDCARESDDVLAAGGALRKEDYSNEQLNIAGLRVRLSR